MIIRLFYAHQDRSLHWQKLMVITHPDPWDPNDSILGAKPGFPHRDAPHQSLKAGCRECTGRRSKRRCVLISASMPSSLHTRMSPFCLHPQGGAHGNIRHITGTFSFSIRSQKRGYRSPRNNSESIIVPSTASMHSPSGITNVPAITGGDAEGIAPFANGRAMQIRRHSLGCTMILR